MAHYEIERSTSAERTKRGHLWEVRRTFARESSSPANRDGEGYLLSVVEPRQSSSSWVRGYSRISDSAGIPHSRLRFLTIVKLRVRFFLSISDTLLFPPRRGASSCVVYPSCSIRNLIASTGSGFSITKWSSSYFSTKIERISKRSPFSVFGFASSNWSISRRADACSLFVFIVLTRTVFFIWSARLLCRIFYVCQ